MLKNVNGFLDKKIFKYLGFSLSKYYFTVQQNKYSEQTVSFKRHTYWILNTFSFNLYFYLNLNLESSVLLISMSCGINVWNCDR